MSNNRVPVHGILLVDKPMHLTSNAVLQRVKHLLNAKKAGHTGSLDPLATGMLPICFGEATKFSQNLLDADKCYVVVGQLGSKTNTGDATGHIIEQVSQVNVSRDALNTVLAQFRGPIMQTPSMFSALKHQGTPLYRYARAGIEIPREPRGVVIHELTCDAFDGINLHMTVRCSKGTYIRNLVEDIGDRLGVFAHVTALRRLYTAGFETDPMYTLEALNEQTPQERLSHLLPMDRAVQNLPIGVISSEEKSRLICGQVIPERSERGTVRLYTHENEFMGLGEIDDQGNLKVRRLTSFES